MGSYGFILLQKKMLVTTLERRLAVAPHWKRDYFILRE